MTEEQRIIWKPNVKNLLALKVGRDGQYITYEDIHHATGIRLGTIYDWMAGKTMTKVSADIAVRFAQYFDVPFESIIPEVYSPAISEEADTNPEQKAYYTEAQLLPALPM